MSQATEADAFLQALSHQLWAAFKGRGLDQLSWG
jgi:hypothetical protein